MSDQGLFGEDTTRSPIPHVEFKHDPNLPGEGLRIRDLVEQGRLTPAQISEIATRVDPSALLKAARDSKLTPDNKFSIRRGNEDIVALVEAGIFQFNEQALREVVRRIEFAHPGTTSRDSYLSKPFVRALKDASALDFDSELPDVVLSRRDIVSSSANAQFLIDCLDAGFFDGRTDLYEKIIDTIKSTREKRDEIPAFREANGYWEKAMRRIEQPVIIALAELGADVRQVESMTLN